MKIIAVCIVFASAGVSAVFKEQFMQPSERQLTHGAFNHNLDNNVNFSPDGRYLVFDCRSEGGIGTNTRLGKVDVRTGVETIFYEQKGSAKGVGAASYLNDREVVAIHALDPGLKYDPTIRGGMIISTDGSGKRRWLDSRNVALPFTPGALRGGTHKHEPDRTGRWIGFTYNDWIMASRNHSDLRNVGVCKRGIKVAVHEDRDGRNFTGESFTVLLTACVENPRPGTDEYRRAEGDCWVGLNGYVDGNGNKRRARAFRGVVAVDEGDKTAFYSDVFIVNVPDDITKPGPTGPLEGTTTDYPKPPAGAVVRRLTRTAEAADGGLRGVSGHLRACGNGKWIAFVGKVRAGSRVISQLFVVSPVTGQVRQLSNIPGGVIGDPRFSPDGKFAACAIPDGSVSTFSAEPKSWGEIRRTIPHNFLPPSNVVVSPDSKLIAFNRELAGLSQVFVVRATP